jgi:hypothetical protein
VNPYSQQPQPPFASNPGTQPPNPRLDPLGIAFMVLGGVDLLWGFAMIAVNVLQIAGVMGGAHDTMDTPFGQDERVGQMLSLALSSCALPVGAVSVFAGLKMRRAEMYGLAIAAAVVNMIPCYQTTCCALFGLPLGIWALVTLMNAEVKASFR